MKNYDKLLANHFGDLADVLEAREDIQSHLKDVTECNENTNHVILRHIHAYANRYGVDIHKTEGLAIESYDSYTPSDLSIATENFLGELIGKIIDGIKWLLNKILDGIKALFGIKGSSSSSSSSNSSSSSSSSNRQQTDKKEDEVGKKLENAKSEKPTEKEAEKKAKEVTDDENKQEQVKRDLMNGKHYMKPEKKTENLEIVVAEVSLDKVEPNERADVRLAKIAYEDKIEKAVSNPNVFLNEVISEYINGIEKMQDRRATSFEQDNRDLVKRFVDGINRIDEVIKTGDREKIKEFMDANQGMIDYNFRGAEKKASSFFFKDEHDAEIFHQRIAELGIGIVPGPYADRPTVLSGRSSKSPQDNELYFILHEWTILGCRLFGYSAITKDPYSFAYPSVAVVRTRKEHIKEYLDERREKMVRKNQSNSTTPAALDVNGLLDSHRRLRAFREKYIDRVSLAGFVVKDDLEKLFNRVTDILSYIGNNYDDEGRHVSTELGYNNLLRDISITFRAFLNALMSNYQSGYAMAYDELFNKTSVSLYELIDEILKSSTAAK